MSSKNDTVLLVAINSRFNHVSLAVRSIESYAKSKLTLKNLNLCAKYFTINMSLLDILSGIFVEKPIVVLFSVYIWNVDLTLRVICELKKVLPTCIIGVGGPEVSFDCEKILNNNLNIDFVMLGEGEQTVTELCQVFSSAKNFKDSGEMYSFDTFLDKLKNISGLFLRKEVLEKESQSDEQFFKGDSRFPFYFTGNRPLIKNLDELVFPYDDGTGHLVADVSAENSIIYYESSRGCPFRCSYCLSSVDKSVRFSSLKRVYRDLDFFLKNGVRLVKFVDRTYNLDENRYIAIWKYIIENWNNKTTFHFEVAAQHLSKKALDAIKNVPYGCMQFEIGIQSTNPKTLEQVGRQCDLEQVSEILSQIPSTIHVHLDLIAGLPFESVNEFASSFNYTISQSPQMLQLGFLKILHGTAMEEYANTHKDYKWLSIPPYEVLCSPWVSFSEMQFLKKIENLVDNYYNSQDFVQTMKFIISLQRNTFNFFEQLLCFFDNRCLFDLPHKSQDYYSYMYDFIDKQSSCESFFSTQEIVIIKELLRFDYTRKTKPGIYPGWYERRYDKNKHRESLELYTDMYSTRQAYTNSSYEVFSVNPLTFEILPEATECAILFLYTPEHITGSASKTAIRSGECLCIDVSSCAFNSSIN